MSATLTDADLERLRRCVQLARMALLEDNDPFGSILVGDDGRILFEDHNRCKDGGPTAHPEAAVAQWAIAHLTPAERADATVYTSGEHCPMCSATHAYAGLGRIVYAVSSAQLSEWLTEWGTPRTEVAPLPITVVAPQLRVEGPADALTDEVKALYEARYRRHESR